MEFGLFYTLSYILELELNLAPRVMTITHKIYTKRSSYLQIRWSCFCFIGSRIGKNLFLLRPKKYWLIRMNCIIHFYLKFYFQNPEKYIINLYKICFFSVDAYLDFYSRNIFSFITSRFLEIQGSTKLWRSLSSCKQVCMFLF